MAIEDAAVAGRFGLQVAAHDGRHRLVLNGELDLAEAPTLEACLRQLCTDGTTGIVLDLSCLKFMDSAGLRMVLLALDLCEEHSCELRLIPGPPQVQRVFEITGMLDQLPFDDGDQTDGTVAQDMTDVP
jgi:anti-sigma B factor antagonist